MGSELTLIGFYSAGLYLAFQHIAERYSPVLARRILLSWKVITPILAMVLLTIFSWTTSTLAWSFQGISLSIIPTGVLLILVLLSTFWVLSLSFSYRDVIKWLSILKDEDWLMAVQDTLSAALSRSDERVVTHTTCVITEEGRSSDCKHRLFAWAIKELRFGSGWAMEPLYKAFLDLIVQGTSNRETQYQQTELVTIPITTLIQQDSVTEAQRLLLLIMDRLVEVRTWSEHYTEMLFGVVSTVWLDADSQLRNVHPGTRLESLQTLIIIRLQHIGAHILEIGGPLDLETYICYLGRLMEETGEDSLVNKGMDLIEGAVQEHKITAQALHEFSSSLGYFRRDKSTDHKDVLDDWVNINVIHLAAALAHIKGKDLHRLLANGGVRTGTLTCIRLDCLSTDDYMEVDKQGGVKVEVSEPIPPVVIEFPLDSN